MGLKLKHKKIAISKPKETKKPKETEFSEENENSEETENLEKIEENKLTRTHKLFQDTVNETFKEYKVSVPDPKCQPCLTDKKKIKWRGPWDNDNKNVDNTKVGAITLANHQIFLKKFFKMMMNTNYRGMLLYHGLGSGKSCSGIAMSVDMLDERLVVFLSPASLKENFISELKKCGPENYILPKSLNAEQIIAYNKKIDREIEKKFFFISYNASNADQKIKEIPDNLNNKILIVDEIHNLISMIYNQGKKGIYFYDAIMNAKNLKIIFLSGTPIINDPFEIAILFNLLVGYIYPDQSKLENIGESIVNPEHYFGSRKRQKKTLFSDTFNFYTYLLIHLIHFESN